MESFGRGIEILCDTVLIPVEPSDESVELAGRIRYMAQGLGIRRIRAVLTKVEDEEQEEYLKERLEDMEVRYLGTLPYKREIRNRNMRGLPLEPDFCYRTIGELTRFLLDEAQMPYQKP